MAAGKGCGAVICVDACVDAKPNLSDGSFDFGGIGTVVVIHSSSCSALPRNSARTRAWCQQRGWSFLLRPKKTGRGAQHVSAREFRRSRTEENDKRPRTSLRAGQNTVLPRAQEEYLDKIAQAKVDRLSHCKLLWRNFVRQSWGVSHVLLECSRAQSRAGTSSP